MNVTESRFKNRQFHMEDYLQMISAEQKEYARENQKTLIQEIREGKYKPNPVRRVEIPKKAGGTRRLGIPTISDRIAQMVARMYIEPVVEPMFSEDSYGYRPNKSAIEAIATTRKSCWRYDYVKGLFDNIDHEQLMKVVKRHVKESLGDTARRSRKSSISKYVFTLCI